MNIHLPAILMFTRGTGFWPIPISFSLPRHKWWMASSRSSHLDTSSKIAKMCDGFTNADRVTQCVKSHGQRLFMGISIVYLYVYAVFTLGLGFEVWCSFARLAPVIVINCVCSTSHFHVPIGLDKSQLLTILHLFRTHSNSSSYTSGCSWACIWV